MQKPTYWLLYLLTVLVYLAGIGVTLFENDSAQFAVMAMRMVQENDFVHLFKGPEEYLDKPHMHYWLAAISFKLFGLHDWAYRLPALLATFLGAYSCYGLGKELYKVEVGSLAALIFMSSQTIVLSVIDVRTDAVLTGFTVLAIWQLVRYLNTGRLAPALLGALAAGIAFSTKGQIALVVTGLPILCYLFYSRQWGRVANWRVFVAIILFVLTISPVLYAYYLQFDLHPEKVIRGRDNRSGILFILWEQSFERLSGEGVGKNSSDYLFFFHTFLWVFLPWTIIGILAFVRQARDFISQGFRKASGREFLTVGGISTIFFIISFAQFKLPHYLNITIPLFALLSAAYLYRLHHAAENKKLKVLLGIQYAILILVIVAVAAILFYVFPGPDGYVIGGLLILILVFLLRHVRKSNSTEKLILVAAFSAIILNSAMNLHFYPHLLEYQGGSEMAKVVSENQIEPQNIFKVSEHHSWGLDFYNRDPVNIISAADLKEMGSVWVYATEDELASLKKQGFRWGQQYQVPHFRITRLQARFLNPETRENLLDTMYLVKLQG